ncbi:MAG: hypothetical protein ACFFG0_01015 [Candidatus Thorarchaeota archaeon]
MKRVVIESPYAGKTDEDILKNEIYGEFAMHDCIVNYNESPYASHLLYTRKYVLRDHIPKERKLGIKAGFYWRNVAQATVFYTDLGITDGMIQGMEDCELKQNPYETRKLPSDLWTRFVEVCRTEGLRVWARYPEEIKKRSE